jgi:hypothetical protein
MFKSPHVQISPCSNLPTFKTPHPKLPMSKTPHVQIYPCSNLPVSKLPMYKSPHVQISPCRGFFGSRFEPSFTISGSERWMAFEDSFRPRDGFTSEMDSYTWFLRNIWFVHSASLGCRT